MKRMCPVLMAVATLLYSADDGVVAGSKWKPWKHATCAAPYEAGCGGCYSPGCYGPGCFAPSCGGCFAPGCSGAVCSQPGCFAPGCGMPYFNCGGCANGYPFPTNGYAPSSVSGYPVMGSYNDSGPVMGGVSMTPAYYAPVAPVKFSVPGIPPVEDLAW